MTLPGTIIIVRNDTGSIVKIVEKRRKSCMEIARPLIDPIILNVFCVYRGNAVTAYAAVGRELAMPGDVCGPTTCVVQPC
jgi:hypothetical protein